MIDDLASRAAMTAAAFLILATGVSLLEMSDGNAVRDAAERLAIHLARQLDAIGTMDAEVVFRGGEAPLSLPPALAGSPYRVEVRRADVRVYSPGLLAAAPLRTHVHPFEPIREVYTAEEFEAMDASVLVVDPGHEFLVERTQRWILSAPTFLTFVYLPP
ncbi:MAG TPA: hypothetical protein VJ400_04945 [Thermoplasmata archaeon]|nr:hypothetical protein [Thermoplasmata archaeon]